MKKRHAFVALALAFLGMALTSCNSGGSSSLPGSSFAPSSPEPSRYTITWVNYDLTILEIDSDVLEGTMPTYDGATPTKPGDAQYSYAWTGWDPFVAVVSGDQTYVAQFGETVNSYTVTWKNYDGSVLEVDQDVPYGETPTYDGATPTKPSTAQYSYAWNGWSPSVSSVVGDQEYVAQFSETVNSYSLSVTSSDDSKGTVSGSGTYAYDSTVTVTATPAEDCVFNGWFHGSENVSGNTTYTFTMPAGDYSLIARFNTKAEEEAKYAKKPILSPDGKTISYGLYPQTHVSDSMTIAALDSLTAPESNGWYLYNGDYYGKTNAKTFLPIYYFDDGTAIKSEATYWFRCEPIEWKVLSSGNEYFVVSSLLLDAHCYYNSTSDRIIGGETVYANNYEYSDIRAWLNGEFYDSAFALGNESIETTNVDNSASTTNSTTHKYACGNTQDKVFLPSYQDYKNAEYGFPSDTDSSRCCKTTDWARARGAYSSTSSSNLNDGLYWTRSPLSVNSDYAWLVRYGGVLIDYYSVDSDFAAVRPSLTLKIA